MLLFLIEGIFFVTTKTLVLNKAGTPVSIVPVKRAINLVSSNRAVVMAVYENTLIRSSGSMGYMEGMAMSTNMVISMPIPSVIQCTKSDYIPKKYTSILPFTRQNVYIRDRATCMYCGKKVSLSNFSFDHVVPRSHGGRTQWTNIVVACTRCNSLKGNKPVGKFKEPIIKPYAPRLNRAAPTQMVSRLATEIPHKSWTDFIYWSIILEP